MKKSAWLLFLFLLPACGGGDNASRSSALPAEATATFRVVDFNRSAPPTYAYYTVTANLAVEGVHCYVYLEEGRSESAAVLQNIANEFDNNVYPGIVEHYGSEPDVDGDPKIYILLLDIRGEEAGASGTSYIAGYFDPLNEFSVTNSNSKEIFFMDVQEGDPSGTDFFSTLAHEFQHMIHWEQKSRIRGLVDDTWLDEAMSEVAPFYAGYGPSWDRVLGFELDSELGPNRSDSLTTWNSRIEDYYVAYMWGQYMADRFPADVFRSILLTNATGIASVEEYIRSVEPTSSFATVFRDWSIALFFGDNTSVTTDNANWVYRTIDTWDGTHGGITLPGMLRPGNRNVSSLPPLDAWSVDMYWYTSEAASPTLTWSPGATPVQASFYDLGGGGPLVLDLPADTPYPYDNAAVLILQNASGNAAGASGSVTAAFARTGGALPSPGAKLKSFANSASRITPTAFSAKPVPVCMQEFLSRRAAETLLQMQEDANAP